jgi:hypothetical protein
MTTVKFVSALVCLLVPVAVGCASQNEDAAQGDESEINARSTYECTLADACEHSDVLDVCIKSVRVTPNGNPEIEVTTEPRSIPEGQAVPAPEVSASKIAYRDVTSTRINITWAEGRFPGGIQVEKTGANFTGSLDINSFGFDAKLTCKKQ